MKTVTRKEDWKLGMEKEPNKEYRTQLNVSYLICCFPNKLKKPIAIYPGECCQNFQQMQPLVQPFN